MHTEALQDLSERWIFSSNTTRPSENTVLARGYDIRAIVNLLPNGDAVDPNPSHLSLQNLEIAIGAYASSHAASSTRRVISTWRQLCLWLVRERLLESNPMDLIEGPRKPQWVPKPLQPEDLSAVAMSSSQPSAKTRNPWPERDEAMFALLIAAGLRISEAIRLEIADCYLDNDPLECSLNLRPASFGVLIALWARTSSWQNARIIPPSRLCAN